jgi:hypothetical protein
LAIIICPVCNRENRANAVFCVYCGVSLAHNLKRKSTTRQIDMESETSEEPIRPTALGSFKIPENGIALYVADYVAPIAIREEQAFIVGRKLSDIQVEKFVDLTPYGAHANGVSSRHIMIRKKVHGYEIIDLGSTNGTMVNEHKLRPNVAYPLPSGAQVHMGKLSLYPIYPTEKRKNKPEEGV